ncbi:efflux RND transporter periplasmic adaptor subunit [Sphingomonas morindae]|uniref:Efflux RND transporter periplasmic adaptor subunit n=1 Tax=Sphingomonas morindae TaxID=1541170 RepID=A0ABY4XB61_9SPHN|nr:efflux RND transporter periplasmic adaptor subunit [Sphingomonas morindae]USI74074.1 efflux RND transporter periplasmic adaptor subunit [Sphingomonas morindae]
MPVTRHRRAPLLSILALGGALAACAKQAPPAKPQPPEVGVITAQLTTVPLEMELPGRTSPTLSSDVRPQVSGILLKRLFTEGGIVHAGQPLYQIDPRLYRAAVGQARGNLASARAAAVSAELKAGRYTDLEKINAVARQDADDARAAAGQARAAIEQTDAALQSAQVNLGFTLIRAPISGRIGRSLVTAGQLVSASQTTALATIQTLDPIFVDIQQSSTQLLALRRALMDGGALPATAPVRLRLEDGSDYGVRGQLLFNEVTVDPSTGAVALRARFANPQGLLLPGMFVRAVVTPVRARNVIALPPQAVQQSPRGDASVLVVGPDNKVVTRDIETEGLRNNRWIVTKGLRSGDRVIIEGAGKAKPGSVVRPVAATGSAAEGALVTAPPKGAMEQADKAKAGKPTPAAGK